MLSTAFCFSCWNVTAAENHNASKRYIFHFVFAKFIVWRLATRFKLNILYD